jgi:hypothetical protein
MGDLFGSNMLQMALRVLFIYFLLGKFLDLLITTFAVSFDAPLRFNLLNKVANLRRSR